MKLVKTNQIRLFCSILAPFCFISMYNPVIAPRYPASEYQAPVGTFEQDFFFNGEYYLAKNYWSITDYAFAGHNYVLRVLISLEQALLLIWVFMSVKGGVGKKGPIASGIHLLFVSIFLVMMMRSMWGRRWGGPGCDYAQRDRGGTYGSGGRVTLRCALLSFNSYR